MAGRLLLLFIVVPLVETWLLIEVGSQIGALATIGMVILTAVIGSQLVRIQGLQTFQEIQNCQRRGEVPAVPMLEGAALLVAGALLVTPGFITDTLGFLALVPPLRKALANRVLRRAVFVSQSGRQAARRSPRGDANQQHTIEGDYRRDD